VLSSGWLNMLKPEAHGVENITKLLVVDFHPIVLEGLRALFHREGNLRVEWTATRAREAIEICALHSPDMCIVDIFLPDGSGIELVRAMHERRSAMPILVMSMRDEALYAERAIRAGARGYITKQATAKQIVHAIHCIQNGEIYLSEAMQSSFINRLACGGDGSLASSFSSLSDRELEVFQLIGMGLTKAQIAEKLCRSANTVEAHRASVKRKLNVTSSAALARLAFLYSQKDAPAQGQLPFDHAFENSAIRMRRDLSS